MLKLANDGAQPSRANRFDLFGEQSPRHRRCWPLEWVAEQVRPREQQSLRRGRRVELGSV